ncbi:hypothetical protein Bca4012_011856 [Brassica carinata]
MLTRVSKRQTNLYKVGCIYLMIYQAIARNDPNSQKKARNDPKMFSRTAVLCWPNYPLFNILKGPQAYTEHYLERKTSKERHTSRTNTKKLEKKSTTWKGGHETALDHAPVASRLSTQRHQERESWLTRPTTNLLSCAHHGEPTADLPRTEPQQPKRPIKSNTD